MIGNYTQTINLGAKNTSYKLYNVKLNYACFKNSLS